MSSPEKRERKKKESSPSPSLPSTPDLPISSPQKKRLITATTKENEKEKNLSPTPTPTPTPQSSPFLSLPYELLLNFVSRVSRLYHPTLSLVCKSFRSLLASPEFYKARSLLGHTESCLYVCIQHGGTSTRWYTLRRKPDKTLINDDTTKSTRYVLGRVPIPDSPPGAKFTSLAAVRSSIYQIAQWRSCSVSVLDCQSHTWREAPSFPVKLSLRSSTVVDQKIYVTARMYKNGGSLYNLFQVFDTETQIWDPLPVPCTPGGEKGGAFHVFGSGCIDGKFHLVTNSESDFAYDSKEGRWDVVKSGKSEYVYDDSHCVIGNVLYSASEGSLRWFDTKLHKWKIVYGLIGLPKLRHEDRVKLGDYGGKMVVSWNHTFLYGEDDFMTKIWCAEISLERGETGQIWGDVEWLDHVLTVTAPMAVHVIKVLAVTV